MADAQKCQPGEHQWGAIEEIRELGVKLGELRTCRVCRWRLYDDYAADRSGGVERMLPPVDGVEFPRILRYYAEQPAQEDGGGLAVCQQYADGSYDVYSTAYASMKEAKDAATRLNATLGERMDGGTKA